MSEAYLDALTFLAVLSSIHYAVRLKIFLSSYFLDYAGYGDNIDPNSLNEIGQIASTGISDSSLQRLLGQLMAGQMGHADHGETSQSLGGLPNDASVFEQGNSEVPIGFHYTCVNSVPVSIACNTDILLTMLFYLHQHN